MTAVAVDHLVVAAATLDEGVAWCERTLGVTPAPGGKHALFGTHNRLLAIGSAAFEHRAGGVALAQRHQRERAALTREMQRFAGVGQRPALAALGLHMGLRHFKLREAQSGRCWSWCWVGARHWRR